MTRGDWVEIHAKGPSSNKDAASGMFALAGCPGVIDGGFVEPEGELLVSVSSWSDAVEFGAPGAGKTPETATLTGYLPREDAGGLTRLVARLGGIGWSAAVSEYIDVDWSSKWRAGIRALRLSYRGVSIVVRPTWSRARTRPGDVTVEIDPGMAFGTGSHATTRMCLRAVLRLLAGAPGTAETTVLDVGCGTGVMAIAARLLGARRAVAVDIDPVAVEATRQNSRRNRAGVRASATPVEDVRGRFDVVVANILSGELKRLAPALAERTAPGGYLVLSGILESEACGVSSHFEQHGLVPYRRYSTGGWSALVLRRARV